MRIAVAMVSGSSTGCPRTGSARHQRPGSPHTAAASSPDRAARSREYHRGTEKPGPATRLPQMWGFQAAGAAPIVLGHPVDDPDTIATAIRIGNPASWKQAERGARRVRWPHRVGHRRADPRRAPDPVRAGGHLRRARLGGLRRRAAPGRRGRARPGRRHRRLHRHRPRPQGPAVGPAQRRRVRRRADPGAGRRVHGGAGARAGGLMGERLARGRASRCGCRRAARTSVPGSTRSGWRSASGTPASRPSPTSPGCASRSRGRAPPTSRVTRPTSSHRTMLRAWEELGSQPPAGLHLQCRNEVPHGRGLGSSATAIVTGIVAAQALHDVCRGVTDQPDLTFANHLAAAARGASRQLVGQRLRRAHPVVVGRRRRAAPDRAPAAAPRRRAGSSLVPATQLSTAKARSVLPTHIRHADAALNSARAALLVQALTAHPAYLLAAHPRVAAPGGTPRVLRRLDGARRPTAGRRARRRDLGRRARRCWCCRPRDAGGRGRRPRWTPRGGSSTRGPGHRSAGQRSLARRRRHLRQRWTCRGRQRCYIEGALAADAAPSRIHQRAAPST